MKPILFSTPMVRAILDGRKTQTRRVIKIDDDPENWKKSIAGTSIVRTSPYDAKLSRYAPGDILWVRETWQEKECEICRDGIPSLGGSCKYGYIYRADNNLKGGWRPSIHMPRAAARIFLRVTDVRVERLQEISEANAIKEGLIRTMLDGAVFIAAKGHFRVLWDSTVKKQDIDKYGWDANPWVWVIEFERCEKP